MNLRELTLALNMAGSALAALLLVTASGCKQQTPKSIIFEPDPRPVLLQAGFTPTRYARAAADPVSSSTVRMLATIGERGHSRLALLTSSDGGDSFAAPVWVSEEGKPFTGSGEGGPAFASTPDQLYAAWNEGDELVFSRSINWGESFDKPIKISDSKSRSFSGYPTIAVAPNQDVYAVWLDTRDHVGTEDSYSVYLARSTDHGASFAANVKIASKTCECCRPTLAFGAHGEVMVIWRHLYQNQSPDASTTIRDMTVAVSADNGKTFSAPQRIAADNWKLAGCPDSGAATARLGDRVYVA